MPRSDGVPTESPQPEKEECQRQPVNGSSHVSICSPTSVPSFPLQLWWQGDRQGGLEVYLSYSCWLTHQKLLSLYMHIRLVTNTRKAAKRTPEPQTHALLVPAHRCEHPPG